MESIRNIFFVGKKDKGGAARWITSFTLMFLILVSVYFQSPRKDFPQTEHKVLRHKRDNATFGMLSCKIEAAGNLNRPNSFLSDDQTFSRYAECLGIKINKRPENFFVHQVVGVMFKKDTHYKPTLILYIELHTTATNVSTAHVENVLKREIESATPSNCNNIFEVNFHSCTLYS